MNEVSQPTLVWRQRKNCVVPYMAWTQMVQGLTSSAIVVLVGRFAVMDGEMTTRCVSRMFNFIFAYVRANCPDYGHISSRLATGKSC